MFLTSINKTSGRFERKPTYLRRARFESLEERRFCTGAMGGALALPVLGNIAGQTAGIQAIGTPAATDCLKLVSLNPQPEPPAPSLNVRF